MTGPAVDRSGARFVRAGLLLVPGEVTFTPAGDDLDAELLAAMTRPLADVSVELEFTVTGLTLDAVALAFGVPRVTLDGPALAAELAEQPLDRWADDGGAAA